MHAGRSRTGEVAITALDCPDSETAAFWLGIEEENVDQANQYAEKAGLNQYGA